MVRVVWKDAHAAEGVWHTLDEVRAGDPYLVTSVGIKIKGKKGHLTLVQTITEDRMCDHIIHILDEMIVSVDELGIVNRA